MTESEPPVVERLTAALRSGTCLDLILEAPDQRLDEAEMRGWDSSHDVDAAVVRDLLVGRHAFDPDPLGLRLRGARIRGTLNLTGLDTSIALFLADCLLEGGVAAEEANLPALTLARCRIGHSDRPATLGAEHLRVAGQLRLDGSVISAAHDYGAVRLSGARVGGQLSLFDAQVRNANGSAVTAEVLRADGNMVLEGLIAEGAGPGGTVRLLSVRVGGQLNLGGASLRNTSGPALLTDHLQTDGPLFLHAGFKAVGSGDRGAVRLSSARTGGLTLSGATVHNDSGPAVRADELQVAGNLWANDGFKAKGAGKDGAVWLTNIRVAGLVTLGGAVLRNSGGPALVADGLQTEDNLFLDERFVATGAGRAGAVRLIGARVGGQVRLGHALVHNATGPALVADGLQADGSLYLENKFVAIGVGHDGAVRMVGARIADQVHFLRALIRNPNGPALTADSLHTGGQVALNHGFTAEGVGPEGAVRFRGSQLGGPLVFAHAAVSNLTGPAVLADRLRVTTDLTLGSGFTARGGGKSGAVVLSGTQVGGLLNLGRATVSSRSGREYRWQIDGLTYNGVPWLGQQKTDRKAWLRLLETETPTYSAQPYQQLAAAYRGEGHDSDVKDILIKQRRDQLARGGLSRLDRLWGRVTGVFLGYGYQPWRSLVWLVAVFLISVTLAIVLGAHGALAQAPDLNSSRPSAALTANGAGTEPCVLFDRVVYGLDLGTPFFPQTTTCKATSGTTGYWLRGSNLGLRFVAWLLAALFIAGFTGIVRKT